MAVVLCAWGCGTPVIAGDAAASSDGGPDLRNGVICDGTAVVKLRVFAAATNERELRGSIVRVENGYPSFVLDGQCNFLLSGGWTDETLGRDLDWRKGRVDASLAQEFDHTFDLSGLGVLQDCVPDTGGADMPVRSLRASTSRAECIRGGPRFEAAWSFVQSHAADLWSGAASLDRGMRVEAVIPSGGDDSTAYPWPVVEALATFVLPDVSGANNVEFSSGVSSLVTDLGVAGQLRRLRQQYVADRRVAPGLFYDGQKMADASATATVYMRDQLPYEDARGLLPFSDMPSASQP